MILPARAVYYGVDSTRSASDARAGALPVMLKKRARWMTVHLPAWAVTTQLKYMGMPRLKKVHFKIEVVPPTVINRPRNDRLFLLGFVGGEVEIIQS